MAKIGFGKFPAYSYKWEKEVWMRARNSKQTSNRRNAAEMKMLNKIEPTPERDPIKGGLRDALIEHFLKKEKK